MWRFKGADIQINGWANSDVTKNCSRVACPGPVYSNEVAGYKCSIAYVTDANGVDCVLGLTTEDKEGEETEKEQWRRIGGRLGFFSHL